MLSLSVVVATRNRPKALALSLPLLLAQSHRPVEIIVVDSSDDLQPNQLIIAELSKETTIPLKLVPGPRGSTVQRNLGLSKVTGEIVVFPDDDSLFFQDALEQLAKVYEADKDGVVVGATLSASSTNPLTLDDYEQSLPENEYEKNSPDILERIISMNPGRWLPPAPYTQLSKEIISGKEIPSAISKMGCRLTADQEGFRMSFRTTAIRKNPFNEYLKGYALGEDKDVCYGLWKQGIIVELKVPLVHHHVYPDSRHGGFRSGIVEVLNTAYIVCRHANLDSRARRLIRPWIYQRKIPVAVLRSKSPYYRERLKGLMTGLRHLSVILDANPSDLDSIYINLIEKLLPD